MKKYFFFALVLFLLPSLVCAYTPPKGIPNPSGSFSTFGEIDQATPTWPTEWTNETTSAVADHYYVDKNHASCSDASNGHPDAPRCKIPLGALAAGSFLYIHTGTYTLSDTTPTTGGNDLFWYGAGTAENPIWITGTASPNEPTVPPIHIGGCRNNTCASGVDTTSSYIVVENLNITGTTGVNVSGGNTIDGSTVCRNSNNIIIRRCVATGTGGTGDSSGIVIGFTNNYCLTSLVSNVVVYDNTVSSFGEKISKDTCGIYVQGDTQNSWVLNNISHDNAADGIAGCHYCNGYTPNDGTQSAQNYFIGGNYTYGNGENGIDLKAISGAIISENTVTGPNALGGGAGVVLHYGDGAIAVENAWVIFNKIYTLGDGIGMGGSAGCDDCHYIGNVIYDISSEYAADPDPSFGGYAIQIGGSHGAMTIVDNTFYDYQRGIYVEDLTTGDTLKIHGNIFHRTDGAGPEIMLNGSTQDDYIDMAYNRFYNAGGAAAFYWNGDTRNLAYILGTAGECGGETPNCTEGAPGMVNPPTNMRLGTGSACIGANVEGPVGATSYDAFATAWAAFSVTIEKDYAGTSRPQGTGDTPWDMGAYEYTDATTYPAHSFGSGATHSFGSGSTITWQ